MNIAHAEYYSNLVLENSNNPKSLFKVIDTLLNNKKKLPRHSSAIRLASTFGNFFMRKVLAIHEDLIGMKLNRNLLPPVEMRRFQFTLNFFKQVSGDDVSKLMRKSHKKTCDLDLLPTWLLAKCHSEFNPIITTIINTSLELCQVSNILKSALVTPFLKKAGLSLIFKKFRPVFNLKFICKLIERTVSPANNALEPLQSVYRAGHSTETALVKVRNDILNAIDNHQDKIMLLLDLSAACDTVNHSILINRLENCVGVKRYAGPNHIYWGGHNQ